MQTFQYRGSPREIEDSPQWLTGESRLQQGGGFVVVARRTTASGPQFHQTWRSSSLVLNTSLSRIGLISASAMASLPFAQSKASLAIFLGVTSLGENTVPSEKMSL